MQLYIREMVEIPRIIKLLPDLIDSAKKRSATSRCARALCASSIDRIRYLSAWSNTPHFTRTALVVGQRKALLRCSDSLRTLALKTNQGKAPEHPFSHRGIPGLEEPLQRVQQSEHIDTKQR